MLHLLEYCRKADKHQKRPEEATPPRPKEEFKTEIDEPQHKERAELHRENEVNKVDGPVGNKAKDTGNLVSEEAKNDERHDDFEHGCLSPFNLHNIEKSSEFS